MIKRKTIFLTIILLILIGGVFFTAFSTANSFSKPMVGEDDEYSKNIKMGSEGMFKWTVYKNSSMDYVVTVSASGLEEWDQKLSTDYFVIDENNPYKIVNLHFRVPEYPEKENREGVVKFHFREINSTDSYTYTKKVTVDVIDVVQRGEENTIFGGFRNPLPAPLNNPIGAFLLNIVIWIFIAFIVYFFVKKILHVFVRKTDTQIDDILIEIIRRPILLLIIAYGFLYSTLKLDIRIGFKATLGNIYSFIVVIVGVYVAYRVFDEILDEISRRRGRGKSVFGNVVKPILKKIGVVVIILGGLIFGLSAAGIEVTALLAGAGVMGLVIAFAAQDTLSNFFSGLHLLLDRPFKMGDIILLEGGEYCRVESIGMRSTKLYSIFNHELIILPNNSIANQKIINIVEPDTQIRARVEVGVAYGSDIQKVMKILYTATEKHPNVVKKEGYEPLVRFTEFGDSSLNFLIIFWVDDVMNQWRTASDIRNEIDKRFREEGITIPFPQRTVWLNQAKPKEKDKEEKKS
ncbi:MAG: mechanosensitive ion channel domain-containing protein [Candidatus Thermoplasmatota archaeon]